MPDLNLQRILEFLPVLPLFLLSLSIHEYAHGWMAYRLGDPTAKNEGRLTLNPLAHIDPLGSLLFFFSFLTGFGFGWAKPVPVRFGNLRNPWKGIILVSAAGPVSNLLQALAWFLFLIGLALGGVSTWAFLEGAQGLGDSLMVGIIFLAFQGVFINLLLTFFNLIPLPPLDGGRIAAMLLPPNTGRVLASLEPAGFLILLLLLNTPVFDWLVITPMGWVVKGLFAILSLVLH